MQHTVLILAREAAFYRDALADEFAEVRFLTAATVDEALPLAATADALIGYAPQIPEALLQAMPRLRWIHALTTGVDNLLASPALGTAVRLTNSHGIHGPQMAELAVLMMLAALRDFPGMQRNQMAGQWVPWPQPLLLNRTACIAGLGAISRELAIRLLPFGMRLTGVSDGRAAAPGFDRIYPRRDIAVAASEADFLIVLTPYSARTHHLVDDTVLRAMRPDAVLLNLSRGGCIDEAALLRHLTEGHLRAAALDVFAQEPLPADSPLWSAPRLIVTPHVGGRSDIYHHQVLPGIRANLTAWLQDPDGLLPDLVMRPS